MRLKKEQIARQIKSSIQDLEDHIAELDVIEKVQADVLNNEFVQVILKDAVEDAERTLKNTKILVEAYKNLEKMGQ